MAKFVKLFNDVVHIDVIAKLELRNGKSVIHYANGKALTIQHVQASHDDLVSKLSKASEAKQGIYDFELPFMEELENK